MEEYFRLASQRPEIFNQGRKPEKLWPSSMVCELSGQP